MAAQRQDDERAQETTGTTMKRRGILAAAAAVVAGIVANQTSQPVGAATGGTQGNPLILGANSFNGTNNTETQATIISNGGATIGSFSSNDAFYALATASGVGVLGKTDGNGTAVYGFVSPDTAMATGVLGSAGAGTGVRGLAAMGTGIYGESSGNSVSKGISGKHTADGFAVYGEAIASGGYGVTGVALDQFGVLGQSDSGMAVRGQVQAVKIGGGANTAPNTIAAYGLNRSTGAGGVGVRGDCDAGIGVLGQSTASTGVYGSTVSGLYGVIGQSGTSQGSAGLLGVATGPNAVGFGTIAQGGATFAGYFNGTTVVNGTFAVTGSGSKAAAVKDASGQHRLLYCEESPEAWFADYGKATLANGAATVKLDPTFMGMVHSDDYHVFLTTYGASQGLDVMSQSGAAFTVQERNKGTSNLTFSWRVVARRADGSHDRLAKFTMPPTLVAPDLSPAPPAPVSPPAPVPTSRPSGASAGGTSIPAPIPAAAPAVQAAPSGLLAPLPPSR